MEEIIKKLENYTLEELEVINNSVLELIRKQKVEFQQGNIVKITLPNKGIVTGKITEVDTSGIKLAIWKRIDEIFIYLNDIETIEILALYEDYLDE